MPGVFLPYPDETDTDCVFICFDSEKHDCSCLSLIVLSVQYLRGEGADGSLVKKYVHFTGVLLFIESLTGFTGVHVEHVVEFLADEMFEKFVAAFKEKSVFFRVGDKLSFWDARGKGDTNAKDDEQTAKISAHRKLLCYSKPEDLWDANLLYYGMKIDTQQLTACLSASAHFCAGGENRTPTSCDTRF